MCPPCLPDYQAYMRGVGRGDQLIGYHNVGRRSKKWWKRVFYYVVQVAALNAYVRMFLISMHTLAGTGGTTYLAYKIALAEKPVGSFRGRRQPGRPRSLEHQQLGRLNISLGHWPEVLQEKRDCAVCSKVQEGEKIDEGSIQA